MSSSHERRGTFRAETRTPAQRIDAADCDADVRCVALVTHHPPVSALWGGGFAQVADEIYARATRCRKFRLFFSGHHHAYQHLTDGERHLLVTGGGGAPTFFRRGGELPEGVRFVKARRAHHVPFGRETEAGVMRPLGSTGATASRHDAVGTGWLGVASSARRPTPRL